MSRTLTLAFLSCVACAAAPGAHAQFYNLAGTGVQAIYGLSGDGSRGIGYGGSSYYTWTAATGPVNIGGTFSSGSPRISDDGSTALINTVNPATGNREMTRYDWATGTKTLLGSLGSSSGGEASSGWGLSGDGSVAVGLGWISAGTAHAMKVVGGTVVDLGSTVAGRSSRANNADADGSVIVGWQDGATGFRQGAAWIDGVQTLVTDGAGNPMGELGDVSADGSWATGLGVASNGFQAYRWSPTLGYQSLGPGLVAGDRAGATAISGDGRVIVGFSRPLGPAQFGRGFIWTEATGMVNLNTYAASLGIDTGGLTLALPLAISADGSTIAGLGSTGAGWVLHLPAAVPEPGTWALMAAGLLALAARRRPAARSGHAIGP